MIEFKDVSVVYDKNIIGIKTGYTSQAKNCLISGYKNNDMELVSNSSIIWKLYKKNTFDVIGLYVFILLIIIIYLIPLIINADGYTINQEIRLLPPSWKENGNLMHFLGTDEYGRDFLSRMLEAEQKTIASSYWQRWVADRIS